MTGAFTMTAGCPAPLGSTCDAHGVNFAVFSQHATKMTLCLFDENDVEHMLLDLPECTGHVWHGHVAGLKPGQRYGFRAHGPYAPNQGHRFNPHKLLLDPYAKQITGHPDWDDALMGYTVGAKTTDLSFDKRDSAPFMPRAVVTETLPPYDGPRPKTPMTDTVIYEAHVRGFVMDHPEIDNPGSFEALAAQPIIDHLTDLGITAIELLPVHAFLNEKYLLDKGLTNYWGYMTHGFFAPDPRYMGEGGLEGFRTMVRRFHEAGIEVILDVVYNHTSEGSELGPTLSFRGLDNLSYYRLAPEKRHYINDTGTGNTLNVAHPMVMRMVMDSLRYWTTVMGVDGFRFDLCSTLGRLHDGFDRNAPFFQAIRQDPVLSEVKMIAEPWDIGPGGYQLGAYPPPFVEWNDKYRDQVRGFWRGDRGLSRKLAQRLSGSARKFDHDGKPATSSVNFLTAHDGFTLMDTVSYNQRHNLANGENGADGHSNNHSDNMGHEGPTDDPSIIAARALRRRNMIATLMLSQGTPMLLAGDELGNSQAGNNNVYCQDNPIGWVNWAGHDPEFLRFCKRIIRFRRDHPILRQSRFLHSRQRLIDGVPDMFWRKADGSLMEAADWTNMRQQYITVEMRTASGTPPYAAQRDRAVYMAFNMGEAMIVTLPPKGEGLFWTHHIDTTQPQMTPQAAGQTAQIAAHSVSAFVLDSAPSTGATP